VWKSELDGRTLHFHLAGINNQNFIMQDEETGSWWQQVSGQAIQGELKGWHLDPIYWEEAPYGTWKKENPSGLVLGWDDRFKSDYAEADWEKGMAKRKTVTPIDPRDPLKPRDLVAGIKLGGRAKAYPMETLKAHNPIQDILGGAPILVMTDQEGRTVRCFRRRVDGNLLDLYRKLDKPAMILVDSQSGSEWDLTGTAVSGPLQGKKLERVQVLLDYWFDWKLYNPSSAIFSPVPLDLHPTGKNRTTY
jgi:hypothetical protein